MVKLLKSNTPVEQLYKRYNKDIFKYSYSILKNITEAEDTVHEVFLKFQLTKNSFNNNCSYKTWLFTITRNLCYNKLKKNNQILTVLDETKFTISNNRNIEDIIALKDAMKKLSPEENEIIYLRDYEKYSYKEIAIQMHLSLENVKIKLFRAKKKLKNIFQDCHNV